MYYVAPEMPMMSSVIADCPDLVPPNILDKSTPVLHTHGCPRASLSDCSSSSPQNYSNLIMQISLNLQTMFKFQGQLPALSSFPR